MDKGTSSPTKCVHDTYSQSFLPLGSGIAMAAAAKLATASKESFMMMMMMMVWGFIAGEKLSCYMTMDY